MGTLSYAREVDGLFSLLMHNRPRDKARQGLSYLLHFDYDGVEQQLKEQATGETLAELATYIAPAAEFAQGMNWLVYIPQRHIWKHMLWISRLKNTLERRIQECMRQLEQDLPASATVGTYANQDTEETCAQYKRLTEAQRYGFSCAASELLEQGMELHGKARVLQRKITLLTTMYNARCATMGKHELMTLLRNAEELRRAYVEFGGLPIDLDAVMSALQEHITFFVLYSAKEMRSWRQLISCGKG